MTAPYGVIAAHLAQWETHFVEPLILVEENAASE